MTGYFDAPGAFACPLNVDLPVRALLPQVTLVFCSIDGFEDMKVMLRFNCNDCPCSIALHSTVSLHAMKSMVAGKLQAAAFRLHPELQACTFIVNSPALYS